MPFTFLAHQAPVLPLKLRWPRAFAGTALVLGSIAPDCEYFLRGQVLTTFSHKLWSQPLFCLPLTLLLVFLVRRLIIGPLAAHLPALPQRGPLGALGRLHLGDYQSLDGVPPGYWPRAVVGARRLEQRDGLGDRTALAGEHALDQRAVLAFSRRHRRA